MNGQVNYKRIAEFLHKEERKAYMSGNHPAWHNIHNKLNRVLAAWKKSAKPRKTY